jgi:predicted TIM-barrel fold metal-dependent hydrolase
MAPVADAHMHLFAHGYHPGLDAPGGSDVDRYEAIMATHDITAALAVGYEGEGIDPDNNAYLRALAAQRPWMSTVAHLPVSPPPTHDELEQLLAAGHSGIALHCPDAVGAHAVAGWPEGRWALLADRGALVSFNATPEAHPGLAELVRTYTGCQFLFSHVGQPGRYEFPPTKDTASERLSALLELSSATNCWVKISALYSISANAHPYADADPFVSVVLDTFGPSRCIWGSDFSPALDHGTFDQAFILPQLDQLSKSEIERVMGANLLQLLA